MNAKDAAALKRAHVEFRMRDGWTLIGRRTFYFLDGKLASKKKFLKRYPPPKETGRVARGQIRRGWPMKSIRLACHPDQVDEMNARNKAEGCNVQYEPGTGTAIVPDRNEHRKVLKIEKMKNRDGYVSY